MLVRATERQGSAYLQGSGEADKNLADRTARGRYGGAMARRSGMLVCALALGVAACGGAHDEAGTKQAARAAAQGYVSDFGRRDGRGMCAHMTKALQRRFTGAVARANPQLTGKPCADVMQAALESLPDDDVARFAAARIGTVAVKGAQGDFRYQLGQIVVDGKVAREGDVWKVSCCVPGQGSG
jgi:hypothetical protein